MCTKVFAIGFYRCGTRSIAHYFEQNGLKSCHFHGGRLYKDLVANLDRGKKAFAGYESTVLFADFNPATEDENAGENGGWLFREIRDSYPDALFILNTRNVQNWLASRKAHRNGLLLKTYAQIHNLTRDENVVDAWRTDWLSFHAAVRGFFANNPGGFLEFNIEENDGNDLASFLAPHYKTNPEYWTHIIHRGDFSHQ